mgnify:CR=1 FL=1
MLVEALEVVRERAASFRGSRQNRYSAATSVSPAHVWRFLWQTYERFQKGRGREQEVIRGRLGLDGGGVV